MSYLVLLRRHDGTEFYVSRDSIYRVEPNPEGGTFIWLRDVERPEVLIDEIEDLIAQVNRVA